MNRKQRRKLEKKGVVDKFDPETQGRVKFSIELPPGLLRDDGKSSRSGQFTADNEVDLTRGMFVKMLESFGYINQQQAVVGLFASVVNPFPKNMRGALAYAIINGTGLQVVEDDVEVCIFCEAEKLMTLDMSDDAEVLPEDECVVDRLVGKAVTAAGCTYPPDADIHDESHNDWLHDFEAPDLPMKDTTKHAANCLILPKEWKEITAVIVLTPQMYEPLQPKADEGETVVEGDTEDVLEDVEPIDCTCETKDGEIVPDGKKCPACLAAMDALTLRQETTDGPSEEGGESEVDTDPSATTLESPETDIASIHPVLLPEE